MSLFRVLSLLLVAISYANCVPYKDGPAPGPGEGPLAVTFSCEKRWCGENWQANRILKYNLSVLQVPNDSPAQHHGPTLNCRGGQLSSDCEPDGNTTENAFSYRTVINRTLSSITKLNSDGYIVTDNYEPGNREPLRSSYSSNQDIVWQIRIPQNCTMNIVFDEFDIESTENCDKDYFTVQISKSQRDIRKYCKTLYNITIQRRRRVQLWFHADETVTRTGIYAQFCFSAIRHGSQGNSFRCDCNQVLTPTIRRRRSRPHEGIPNMVSRGVRPFSQEEGMRGGWLHSLMNRGEHVEEHRVDSSNPRRQLLAQRYRRILNRSPSNIA